MSDFHDIPAWQSPEGVPETEWKQSIRARFWAHLIIVLPSELRIHKDLPDGDVRGVYENLLTIDKTSAIAQTMALRAKLSVKESPQSKEGEALLPWLDELFQVHTLRDGVSEKEVRQHVYNADKEPCERHS